MRVSVEDIAHLFWQFDHRLVSWIRQQADEPLALSTFLALNAVEHEGPLSMQSIAELLEITPASTTALVKKLEDKGWAIRQVSPEDQRVKLVMITAVGKEALRSYYQIMKQFFERALTEDEQATFAMFLGKLIGISNGNQEVE